MNYWSMDKVPGLRWVVGVLFLCYPIMVYFGLSNLEPRSIAFLLLLLIGIRFLGGNLAQGGTIYWVVAAVAATGFTLLTGSKYGLLIYPVLVNAAFLLFFAMGLFNPPTVIEKIARLREPDFPPEAIEYTRKVTLVWCGFFILNGGIAFATIFLGERWWVIYNGFIAYMLMGALFAGEFVVRRIWKARQHG